MASAARSAPRTTTPRAAPARRQLSSRTILVGGAAALFVLTLIVIAQALNAYNTTYEQFRSVAEDSTAKVSAAEAALGAVFDIDTHAASFVATAPDNQNHWKALDTIHAAYQTFREQMFTVRSTLQSDDERKIYDQIDYFAFDQFWQHIGNLLTAQQHGDKATAINEYIISDNYLQNQIARYLLQLEALNFKAMQDTEKNAGVAINGQTLLLGVLVILLAIGLTALSFWLRSKVKRFVTPGLDVAMVLGWVLAILMLIELASAPGQLRHMVDDAYYSVSASSRVLAIASEANSAQRGSVIDPTHAPFWQASFDANKTSLALRLCGQPDCTAMPFTNGADQIAPNTLSVANQITSANSSAINGIQPLVAKVSFAGEATTLEKTRMALQDYLKLDGQIRGLIQANDPNKLDDATRLSTGSLPGQSGEAFTRFTDAMNEERTINRRVFDDIWNTQKSALPLHRILFGLVGFVLLGVLLVVGVYHRFREL